MARSTWLGRPDPLAQADPAENMIWRQSLISRATSKPSRRMLILPFQRSTALPFSVQSANAARAMFHKCST